MSDKMDENSQIKNHKTIKPYTEVTQFHGHVCPGSAIGYKAAEAAVKELGLKQDDKLVGIVENDTCGVDAVQVVTGCTFGKGNLIFVDHGKQVYTFINRNSECAVQISLKNSFDVNAINPKLAEIRKNANISNASETDKLKLKDAVDDTVDRILRVPYPDMFDIEHTEAELNKKSNTHKSYKCFECDEMVSEHRTRIKNGEKVCIPCFEEN